MKQLIITLTILAGVLLAGNNCAPSSAVNNNQGTSNQMVYSSPSPLITPAETAMNNAAANSNAEMDNDPPPLNDSSEVRDSQDEGQREAEKFWSQYAPTCSGVTYMKSGKSRFVEFNGFHIEIEYTPLTEADSLNGVQKKGITRLKTSTHRLFYDSKWHEWQNGLPPGVTYDARFEKRQGQWKFEGGGYFNDFIQTMNCSEVPSSTSAENSLLRFDGLYRAFGEDTIAKDSFTYWFKFYQDGTVSFVAHQNAGYRDSGTWWTVKKVWECLVSVNQGAPCRPEVMQGTYVIAGSKLTFELKGSGNTIKWNGMIEQNSLTLKSIKRPDKTFMDVPFEFIELSRN